MRIILTLLAPLAAAATIVGVPMAMAVPIPLKNCVATTSATLCQTPGDIDITGPRPAGTFYPYPTLPVLLGN